MVRYLSLLSLTNQGIAEIGNSTARANAFAKEVQAAGGKVLHQGWTLGKYDGALLFEAPSEAVAAQLLLKLAQEGYVRTKSMRLFDAAEFQGMIQP